MNPPGIPMFYGSSTASTAVREVRRRSARVGRFQLSRDVLVLDLVHLPRVPGIFSNPDRRERLTLRFLHQFTRSIMQPVDGDDRTHIDYIPSQVATEYLRDYAFEAGRLEGMTYPSTVDRRGHNIVLFIDSVDPSAKPPPPLKYVDWKRVKLARAKG